ncbi:ClpXP protease specificity-enhancing factor SspB [Alphaproteobacteria bacterium]|nr:ClpXP protease specificity-enhancing factor SspB [Alphaproteobacteria bacterium]MDC1022938.1 ClpXP protease specificity-enhancing factor SspB [Alphaproteobacteria bacterium]
MANNKNDDGSASHGFNYDALVEESLKNVVKKVLKITAEKGLKGNSHFFISFNGADPDVEVPAELKSTDTSEIKIIIQHQFWNLKSTNNHFEVTLSFNGKKKNISVPYRSVTSFTDPSVGFGLQFKIDEPLKILNEENQTETPDKEITSKLLEIEKSGEIVSLDAFRDKK